MFIHRWRLVRVPSWIVLLSSIWLPAMPTSAAETGSLTLNLNTRRVIGTAASASVTPTPPEGAISSWAGLAYSPVLLPDFLLDGIAPDGGDGVTFLTWNGVGAGTHTITIPTMLSTYEFTSQAGAAETLWGVLYDASIPSQSSGVTSPVPVDTTTALSVAPGANSGVSVSALPVTGVGPDIAQAGRLLAVIITILLMVGGILRHHNPREPVR